MRGRKLDLDLEAEHRDEPETVVAPDRRSGDAHAAGRDGDQVREVARRALPHLDDLDPPLGRDQRRVDVVHELVDPSPERAVERGERQQPRVALGELAVVLERDRARLAAGELEREAAEARRERQERAEHLEILAADRRDVHRVRDDPALERGRDLLGDDHAGAVLRLVGRGGEVRRHDDVRRAEQRARVGLLGEDVDRGAAEPSRLERVDQRRRRRRARRGRR